VIQLQDPVLLVLGGRVITIAIQTIVTIRTTGAVKAQPDWSRELSLLGQKDATMLIQSNAWSLVKHTSIPMRRNTRL
jgi:hypothetical protein